MILTGHSREGFDQTLQIFSRLDIADIEKIRLLHQTRRRKEFRRSRQRRDANALLRNAEMPDDFPFRIFGVREHQPRPARNSRYKAPGIEPFPNRVEMTQYFESHIVNR